MEKLEKKKETLNRQEDLLIQEKERNLALEKSLAEERAKVEKLSIDLSLANDSNKMLMKENTMASDSLASLKATNGELQDILSSLTVKYKDLEVNYNVLGKAQKPIPRQFPTPMSPQVKVALNAINLIYKLVLLTLQS